MATEQPNPPAIEFRHVSLSFEDNRALDDVSFELAQGEMIFLTGASASGKSVLLHLAMGLMRPDEGQIFVEGREIEALDETELVDIRGRRMGIVFQEDSLFTGLTAYDNAAYRLDEHDVAEDETEREVLEVLRFVGLEQDAEKFPEELSGGMRRRLEIARALIGWLLRAVLYPPCKRLRHLNNHNWHNRSDCDNGTVGAVWRHDVQHACQRSEVHGQ
jgi:phospholipid/cholesterol/gamma-HCH transport system ATP-binding protein